MRRLPAFIALTALMAFAARPAPAVIYSVGLDKKNYTSDFMIGKVVVSIIFPESDGTFDPNSETWSDDRKAQVLSKIMSGLDWWTRQNPRSPLSFTYVSQTVKTKYEPITRPYYDESLWMPDVLTKLGYTGSRFTAARNYVNDLRTQHAADWGFVIYVVDSRNDVDGKFTDGLFAYAYLGGPFLVLTYDNNGYGIGNMDVVAAHEVGHVFHALDQYAGASSPYDYSSGYFSIINGNHAYSTAATEPSSIMRGGLRWGLDDWSRQMVGWRDVDKNGRDDIVDRTPTVSVSQSPSAAGGTAYGGQATVAILPRQGNSSGAGFTVDTIAKVEYRVRNGDWAVATAVDGTFDSATEAFQVPVSQVSAQSISAQDLDVRAVTTIALRAASGGGGGGGSTAGASSLTDAHPFPNPFKPNSGLGHTTITFTNLTNGAKVQIFTVAGEPVYEKTIPASSTTLAWPAVDDGGESVASGVYYYLITDTAGNKKKGKLAVVR